MKKINHPLPYLLLTLAILGTVYALQHHTSAATSCGLTPASACQYKYDMRGIQLDLHQPGLSVEN